MRKAALLADLVGIWF